MMELLVYVEIKGLFCYNVDKGGGNNMYISKLILENFRKYEKLEVEFNPNLNVLVG